MKFHHIMRLLCLVWPAILLGVPLSAHVNTHTGPQTGDAAAMHNMLLFGQQTIYLSHWPMFQERDDSRPMPHRYQVLLEVELKPLPGETGQPQETYRRNRETNPQQKIYSFSPENFVLPDLVSSDPQLAPRNTFKGAIYRGHLERPGNQLLERAQVQVKRVVYFREFDLEAEKPRQLEYLLFGRSNELWLAHLITRAPDFDHILGVEIANHPFTPEQLAQGVRVVFNRENSVTSRLRSVEHLSASVLAPAPDDRDGTPADQVTLTIKRELYFEEGELRDPADMRATTEEEKAGFR